MTLDDLVTEYNKHCGNPYSPIDIRAGIRSVVAALRDEMCVFYEDKMVIRDTWDLKQEFDEILGSDAVEAAGGPTSNDGRGGARVERTLLQAPAADVCEWRLISKAYDGNLHCKTGCKHWAIGFSHQNNACPNCGKPIAFKEPTP